MFLLETTAWEGLTTEQEYAEMLRQLYPALPEGWHPLLASQLAERRLHPAGVRVHASQLHAPGLVLLGDAGHGVTPRTGNGMNAAMEDAWVLNQVCLCVCACWGEGGGGGGRRLGWGGLTDPPT